MIVAVLVVSALSVVGTDEVTETEDFTVKDGAYAVVLDEAIVPYSGTSVTVEAANADGKELFVGTANGVDTDSILDGVAQEQISNVEFPSAVEHRFIPGDAAPEATLTDRDWWISQDTGEKVAKTFDLDADPQVLVISAANEGENLDGTTVSLKMRVEGVLALSLFGIALGIILAGFAAFFFLRWFNGRIRPEKKKAVARNTDRGSGPGPGSGSRADAEGARADSGRVQSSRLVKNPDPAKAAPPRRTSTRGRRSLRMVTAVSLTTGLALSGCTALPVAQPHSPDITPYERTAMRPGEAGTFMTGYTESLDGILNDGGAGLEKIQGEPLIDRTRAQILIAKKAKQKLRAPNFSEVVAGSPSFTEYPMWFYAFGTAKGDEKLTQVQLATRESASTDPIVRTASYIPTDQMPTLMADGHGAVEPGPDAFNEEMTTTADQVSKFLVDGKADKADADGLKEGGFKDFRGYLGDLRGKDSGFDKVDVSCKPYEKLDFTSMTLSNERGAIGMGEVRCTLTIEVPDDYSVDLGDTIEAVKSNDKDGNTVKVDTAHPYVLMKTGDELSAVATDWNVLSSRFE
ncbi:hypothetical protein BANT918_01447 [Brevibacterium antiquum CNRZ 918]|uniref:Uncharacterized protein n=1 Tax=Brevibacterium antiquum CNRZ 918 TaxID=1255637 RepID=A0A2H1JAM1_9MICO|nr:hypothetical protein BANT918_01447 [Brevibacterium antiquum CNRZ 918]